MWIPFRGCCLVRGRPVTSVLILLGRASTGLGLVLVHYGLDCRVRLGPIVTDIKSVLTQKGLKIFCEMFHIPDEVHPQLPSPNQTIHEMPTEMDLLAFIWTVDPTKVKVGERQRAEDEPRLLDSIVGRVVPLLLVAPAHAKGELEASADKLFDEGGSGNQAETCDSASGGQGDNIQSVSKVVDTVVEDVVPLQPRRQRKRKTVVVDVGGSSHRAKKLREDHKTPSGTSVAGKSMSAIQRLLTGAVHNVEVRGEVIPTLPFVTSSAEVDSLVRKFVEPSLFGAGSSLAGGADHTMGGFFDLTGSDFIVGGIHTVISPDTDLQKVYVPQWSVTNRSRLDDSRVCHEMVDEFAPPKFFASIRGMEHDQLFTEFNVGAARQMSLSTEVRMRAEYNIREKRRLKFVAEERAELLKVRERELEDLKAQLLLKEAEAAEAIRLRAKTSKFEAVEKSLQDEVTGLKASVVGKDRELTNLNAQLTSAKSYNDNLVDQVHELEISSSGLQEKVTVYEDCMSRLEKFQDDRMKEVNDKFDKLYADFIEMALHLEEKFYPHLLTTISSCRWLLTHGMELAIIKCLNSTGYLSAFGAAIGKAIEKGMQDGLSAGITHGREGRVLIDVAAYNPSTSNKDASVETLMNVLRLEEALAERLGLNELQPRIDQLMVPIHHSPEKVVVGATALSLALDVSSVRVRKIRENIANQRSALHDVFVPLAEPFSSAVLTGMKGTSDTLPSTVSTTTSLSITFASASLIAPISIDDYEVVGTDDQTDTDGNDAPFPNVDDVELNIP
ncbi:hypothetical protein Tco_0819791 [Tanacetum coccineum]|uniref:Transposase (Putative), gypsy type n=1 Tax=Tanacetum coccineum TaxID=301880 RepID=A0ABQ5AA78_9ASTR